MPPEDTSNPLAAYFNALKEADVSETTEHTLRGALENLLNAIAADENPNIKVIHEPKQDQTGLGAPDFKIKLHEAIVGYLENKKIGDNLDAVLQGDQIAKYKRLSGNLLLTDYLEWIWLKDGDVTGRETLAAPIDVGNRRARLAAKNADAVRKLIAGFLSVPPDKLDNAGTCLAPWPCVVTIYASFCWQNCSGRKRNTRKAACTGCTWCSGERCSRNSPCKNLPTPSPKPWATGCSWPSSTPGKRPR